MKTIKIYLMVLLGLFVLSACGGGGDDAGGSGGSSGGGGNNGHVPQAYAQSVSIPATSGDQVITLSSLNSSVSSVSSSPSWLVISPQFYSSGAPTLKLVYQENTETQERKAVVTVSASSGDRVVLTITQQAGERKDGIDDLHNDKTDQPSYAPQL